MSRRVLVPSLASLFSYRQIVELSLSLPRQKSGKPRSSWHFLTWSFFTGLLLTIGDFFGSRAEAAEADHAQAVTDAADQAARTAASGHGPSASTDSSGEELAGAPPVTVDGQSVGDTVAPELPQLSEPATASPETGGSMPGRGGSGYDGPRDVAPVASNSAGTESSVGMTGEGPSSADPDTPEAGSGAGDWVPDGDDEGLGGMGEPAEQITETVEDVVTAVSDTVEDAIEAVGDLVEGVFDGATGAVGDVLEAVTGTVDGVSDLVEGVVDGATGAVGDVLEAVTGTVDDVSDLVEGVVDGATGTVGDVLDAVTGAADGAVELADGFVGEAADAIGGIAETVDDALEDVTDLAESAISGATDAVGGAADVVSDAAGVTSEIADIIADAPAAALADLGLVPSGTPIVFSGSPASEGDCGNDLFNGTGYSDLGLALHVELPGLVLDAGLGTGGPASSVPPTPALSIDLDTDDGGTNVAASLTSPLGQLSIFGHHGLL